MLRVDTKLEGLKKSQDIDEDINGPFTVLFVDLFLSKSIKMGKNIFDECLID